MVKFISILTPVYVTIFWSILFLIQKNKIEKPKKYLGIFMIFAFLLYFSHAVFFNKYFLFYSQIEFIYVFCMLSVYPMYFIYLQSLTTDKIQLKDKLHHFIPAIFFSSLVLITSLILNRENRINYVEEILINRNLKNLDISTFVGTKGFIFLVSRIAFLIQIFHYAFNGIKLANKHNERIEDYYSNTEGRTLDWVRTINIVVLLIALSSTTFTFIGRGYFSQNEELLIIPSAIFSTLIFIIGFKGNQHVKSASEFENDFDDFISGNIKVDQTEFLKYKLLQLFENDKIYRHPDLKITHISEKLNTNRTYISKLINDEMNVNFNEFVNKYRINEAKILMKSENGKITTLEMIAEESGFGSVNSFTRVFKSVTGVTPGKYRDSTKANTLSD